MKKLKMNDSYTLVIGPKKNIRDFFNFKELYQYKDLFFELIAKDIKLRHKQTILGVAWAIFQPLLSTLIFTLFFGSIIKIPTDGLPYPIFVYMGLMFWNFFSNALTSASGSLVGNESLIKKIYFPRVIIPLSSIATNLFDFGITVICFWLIVLFYGVNANLIFIIVFLMCLLLVLITLTGSSLFLSALNVKYRDVRQVLPFFIQILIFVTPVIYPVSIVSYDRQWILALNPLTTAIDVSRKIISNQTDFNWINIAISLMVSLTVLLIGSLYFFKAERTFADNI